MEVVRLDGLWRLGRCSGTSLPPLVLRSVELDFDAGTILPFDQAHGALATTPWRHWLTALGQSGVQTERGSRRRVLLGAAAAHAGCCQPSTLPGNGLSRTVNGSKSV